METQVLAWDRHVSKLYFLSYWVNDCCLTPSELFNSHIMARTSYKLNVDCVRFVLDTNRLNLSLIVLAHWNNSLWLTCHFTLTHYYASEPNRLLLLLLMNDEWWWWWWWWWWWMMNDEWWMMMMMMMMMTDWFWTCLGCLLPPHFQVVGSRGVWLVGRIMSCTL